MKMCIIYSVPAQIPYLGKFLFLRYRLKCFQAIRLQHFLINQLSLEPINEIVVFLYVDTYSHKLKVDQKIFGLP